jgi:RimJ/RimL family protein N-acetyltransferase
LVGRRRRSGDHRPAVDSIRANDRTSALTFADCPILETPRLRLRPHRLDDFESYAAMWAEPQVVRFIGGRPMSREAAWIRFLRQVGLWRYLGFGFFALEDRESGAFVGEAGFHDLRRTIVPSNEGTMEAGWALVPSAQGRGLAEEAMRAAIAWADRVHAGRRMTCIVNAEHAASLRVAAKLGFTGYVETTYHGDLVTMLERPRPGAPHASPNPSTSAIE